MSASEEFKAISEIVPADGENAKPPKVEWEIHVIERGLSQNLGDLGGREPFIANARVRVTEPDGSSWEGLTIIED